MVVVDKGSKFELLGRPVVQRAVGPLVAQPSVEARLHALLSRRGHEVNVKRVYKLYVEEGVMGWRKRLVREHLAEHGLDQRNVSSQNLSKN